MNRGSAIGVGIWGIGEHARRNLIPALLSSAAVELAAVHTRRDDVLAEVAESTGATPYRDVDRFLDSSDVEVILVASPTGLHADMAMEVIGAGKHVWCEKPMTIGHEETRRIVDAAWEAGLVALETDMFLHHPQFIEMARIARSGDLGPIASVTARFGFPHVSETNFRYSSDLGGGALLDAAFYPVAAVVALLGSGLRTLGAEIQYQGVGGVDVGGAALLASDGSTGMLDWGFGRAYRSEIEIWCERGTIAAERAFAKPETLATSVTVRSQVDGNRVEMIDAVNHFTLMFDHFAEITTNAIGFDPTAILERSRLLDEIRTLGTSDAAAP